MALRVVPMDEALPATDEEVPAHWAQRPPADEEQNVTITLDGRRIDSREKALAWVEELNALRRGGPIPPMPT
jgi:hypothetical protein